MRHYPQHVYIADKMGCENYYKMIRDMYHDDMMSSGEISEAIDRKAGIYITPRSIQRAVKKHGTSRSIKEAYNLAITRGRVQWSIKPPKYKRVRLSNKMRYQILTRDNFRCVKCGRDSKQDLIEVDHIVSISQGGRSTPENLQTLCQTCNSGKD